jgi:transposase
MSLYIGIDWSEQKHDIAYVNEHGGIIHRQTIPHSEQGFYQFHQTCQTLNGGPDGCIVGLETAHSLLVDYLWAHDYQALYVLPPNVVNKSRDRHRQSVAKNDALDAYVIADILRTDRHRLRLWHPGSALLQELRIAVRFHNQLTEQVTQQANRLRTVLLRYYPAAYHFLPSWPTRVACRFVLQYPAPADARSLSGNAFWTFLRQAKHPRHAQWMTYFQRLQADYPVAAPAVAQAYQQEAIWLAHTVLDCLQAKTDNLARLTHLFDLHPDADIFRSLPGAGPFLAPALLVKFGEDRTRFPTATAVRTLAGTCPVTKQSGKHRSVHCRRACDREFRHIAQTFAHASLRHTNWTNAYYQSTLSRRPSRSWALRCLANRWLGIVWTLWRSSQRYDEAIHLRNLVKHRSAPPVR